MLARKIMKNNYEEYLDLEIKKLDLEQKLEEFLKVNNIYKVRDLWVLNKKKLKTLGFKDSDIKIMSIKLQLFGLDFNKKIYY